MIKYIKNEINRKVFSSRLISVVSCSRVAAFPLRISMSLCDRIPRGVIYIHTTCDYCFVIASMGVRKKRAEALFIYVCPWGNSHWLNCSCYANATQTVQPSSALRLTNGSAINPVVVTFGYSHSTRTVKFWLNILALLSIL